jgi:hypothetical protein
MESISINEYFERRGVVVDSGVTLPDLYYITLNSDHHCWRYGHRFLFCGLTDVPELKVSVTELRRTLQLKYYPGNMGVLTKLHDLIKSDGPTDDTISKVMKLLSSLYKKLINTDIREMSIARLYGYCDNFMDSIVYIRDAVITLTHGKPFIDLPGIQFQLTTMVERFEEIMIGTIGVTGDTHGVVKAYSDVICMRELVSNMYLVNHFKLAYNSSISNVTKQRGSMESITFSVAVGGLDKIFRGFATLGEQSEYDVFRGRLHRHGDTRTNVAVQVSPVKHKRARMAVPRKRTWRDKRPKPITTNIKVVMPQIANREKRHVMRKSVRLTRLNPRRSIRIKCNK